MSFDPWVKGVVDLAVAAIRANLAATTHYDDPVAFEAYLNKNLQKLYQNERLIRTAGVMRLAYGKQARCDVLANRSIAVTLLPVMESWPYANRVLAEAALGTWEELDIDGKTAFVENRLDLFTRTPLEKAPDPVAYVQAAFSVWDAITYAAERAGQRYIQTRTPSEEGRTPAAKKPRATPRKKAPTREVRDLTAKDEAISIGDLVLRYGEDVHAGSAQTLERARYLWNELAFGLSGWKNAHGNPHEKGGPLTWGASDPFAPQLDAFVGAFAQNGELAEDYVSMPSFLTEYPGPWTPTEDALLKCAAWLYRSQGSLGVHTFLTLWGSQTGMDFHETLTILCAYETRDRLDSWRLDVDDTKLGFLDETIFNAVTCFIPGTRYFSGYIGPRFHALDAFLTAVETNVIVPENPVYTFMLTGLQKQQAEKSAYVGRETWERLSQNLDPRDTYIPTHVLSAWLNARIQVALPNEDKRTIMERIYFGHPVLGAVVANQAGNNLDISNPGALFYWSPTEGAPCDRGEDRTPRYYWNVVTSFGEKDNMLEPQQGYAPTVLKIIRSPMFITIALRKYHEIQPGENVGKVASLYRMDEADLHALNPGVSFAAGTTVDVWSTVPLQALKSYSDWKKTYRNLISDRVRLFLGWLNNDYSMFAPDPFTAKGRLEKLYGKDEWGEEGWPEGYPMLAGALGAENVLSPAEKATWTLGDLSRVMNTKAQDLNSLADLFPGLFALGYGQAAALKQARTKISQVRSDQRRDQFVEAFTTSFRQWLSQDTQAEYREAVLQAYTDRWLSYKVPDYADVPLSTELVRASDNTKPPMGPGKMVPYPYQSSGARRVVEEGGGMLAFDVGVGKTLCALLALAKAKQEGKAKRAVIAVPGSITAKWEQDVRDVLPGYRVVVIGQRRVRPSRIPAKGRLTVRVENLREQLLGARLIEAAKIHKAGKSTLTSPFAHAGDNKAAKPGEKVKGAKPSKLSVRFDKKLKDNRVEMLSDAALKLASQEADMLGLRGSAFWTKAGFEVQGVIDLSTTTLVDLDVPIPGLIVRSETPQEVIEKWHQFKQGRYDVAICSHGTLSSHTALDEEAVDRHIAASRPILRVLDKKLFGHTGQYENGKKKDVPNSRGQALLDELTSIVVSSTRQLRVRVLGVYNLDPTTPGFGPVEVPTGVVLEGTDHHPSRWTDRWRPLPRLTPGGLVMESGTGVPSPPGAPPTYRTDLPGYYVFGEPHGSFNGYIELMGKWNQLTPAWEGLSTALNWKKCDWPCSRSAYQDQWQPQPFSDFAKSLHTHKRGRGEPLVEVLSEYFPKLSVKAKAKAAVEEGRVKVNGMVVKPVPAASTRPWLSHYDRELWVNVTRTREMRGSAVAATPYLAGSVAGPDQVEVKFGGVWEPLRIPTDLLEYIHFQGGATTTLEGLTPAVPHTMGPHVEAILAQRIYVEYLTGEWSDNEKLRSRPEWVRFGDEAIAVAASGTDKVGHYVDIVRFPKGYTGPAVVDVGTSATGKRMGFWTNLKGTPAVDPIAPGTTLSGWSKVTAPSGYSLMEYASQLEQELTDPKAPWRKDAVRAWVTNQLLPKRNYVDPTTKALYEHAFLAPQQAWIHPPGGPGTILTDNIAPSEVLDRNDAAESTLAGLLGIAGVPVGTLPTPLGGYSEAMKAQGTPGFTGETPYDLSSNYRRFPGVVFFGRVHPRYPDGVVSRNAAQGWFRTQGLSGTLRESGSYYPVVYKCAQALFDDAASDGVYKAVQKKLRQQLQDAGLSANAEILGVDAMAGEQADVGVFHEGEFYLYAEYAAATLAWVLDGPLDLSRANLSLLSQEVKDKLVEVASYRETGAAGNMTQVAFPLVDAKVGRKLLEAPLTIENFTDKVARRFGSPDYREKRGRGQQRKPVYVGVEEAKKFANALSIIPKPYPTRQGKVMVWNDLRCDFLIVDEAHNFKALFLPQKRGSLAGGQVEFLSLQASSALAWQLEFRASAVRGNGGRIVLLTATPAATSPIEFYNVLHYLGQPGSPDKTVFQPVGIRDPEEFISRYVEIEDAITAKPGHDPEERKTAKRFKNIEEFRLVFDRYANRKTVEDSPHLRGVEVVGGRNAMWYNVDDPNNPGQRWGIFRPGEVLSGELRAVGVTQRLRIVDGTATGDFEVHSVELLDGECVIRTPQVFPIEVNTEEEAKTYGPRRWSVFAKGLVPLAPPTQQVLIGMEPHQYDRYAAYQRIMGTSAALGMGSLLGSMSRTCAHFALELFGRGDVGLDLELPDIETEDEVEEDDEEAATAKRTLKREKLEEASKFVAWFWKALPAGSSKRLKTNFEKLTPVDSTIPLYMTVAKDGAVPHEDALKLRFIPEFDADGDKTGEDLLLLAAPLPRRPDPDVYPAGLPCSVLATDPKLTKRRDKTYIELVLPFRPLGRTPTGKLVKDTGASWVVVWRGHILASRLIALQQHALERYKEDIEAGTGAISPWFTVMEHLADLCLPGAGAAYLSPGVENLTGQKREDGIRFLTVEAVARLLSEGAEVANLLKALKLQPDILAEAQTLVEGLHRQAASSAPVIFRPAP